MYDLIIKRGKVVDGSGLPAFTADVAVRDGRSGEPLIQTILRDVTDRRQIEDAGNGPRLARIEPAFARPPDHAEHPTRPERHLDEIARRTAPLRCEIIERAPQRLRGQHRHRRALVEMPGQAHALLLCGVSGPRSMR